MRRVGFVSPAAGSLKPLLWHTRRPRRHCACAAAPAEPLLSVAETLRHSRPLARATWTAALRRAGCVVAVDATAGRGSDTLQLARLVGNRGVVHAIDVQAGAVAETRKRFEDEKTNGGLGELRAVVGSHEDLGCLGLDPRSVAVVTYNLGFYPGRQADRNVVTQLETTVSSLRSAEKLVSVGGVISVTAYSGHEGGAEEEDAVLRWAEMLCTKTWSTCHIRYPNRASAPSLVLCERLL